MYITLQEARKHLQLDDYFHDDDSLILDYIRAAEDVAEKRANRSLRELTDPQTGELRPSTKSSILLLVGHFYNQREATTAQNLRATPLGFEFLNDLDRRPALG